jgi:hypothetical protein
MEQRYQEISEGLVREGDHERITIIIDEWMAIEGQCSNASETIKRLLTESRKAVFSIYIGTHSERVRSLGLEGQGDLRDGFTIVRLSVVNGQHRATLDNGNGELPVILPGPYLDSSQVIEAEALDLTTYQPTDEEQQVIELHKQGLSHRKITEQVWGQRGKFYDQKVDNILARSAKS